MPMHSLLSQQQIEGRMNVKKSNKTSSKSLSQPKSLRFVMARKNYQILLAGIITLLTGYMLMSGGGNPDPSVFDESIFSFRRITLAPIIVLLGYVMIGFSIMYTPKSAEN